MIGMNILTHFEGLVLTLDQRNALINLEAFLKNDKSVFILKGYAGSGKTTILKGLLGFLNSIEKKYVLMAPTGRAAKVIQEKTKAEAYTIHKTIYNYEELQEVENPEIEGGKSFVYYYKIRSNNDVANNIFIVDEASMLSDAKSEGEFFRFGTGHLLSDLITYTRITSPTANTKIIFIGDPCQLPPVGDSHSKAFDEKYLLEKFGLSSNSSEMREVKRQHGESGILKAATKIRKCLSSGYFNEFDLRNNSKDISNPKPEYFLNIYDQTPGTKIIIASKNKTCLNLNLEIRERKFGNKDLPLQKGDIVIVGGNNYRKGIMNGEFAIVNEADTLVKTEKVKFYPKVSSNKSSAKPEAIEVNLTWRKVELIFPDKAEESKVVRGQMLENFLYGENFLSPEEMQALYVNFKNRHPNLKPKTEEFKEAIINDDYFNCILLKYGYAVTCHKAQGGEWENAFVVWDNDTREGFNCFKDEQRKEGKTNSTFYRWAYTAITRASKKLFTINPPYFTSYASLSFVEKTVATSYRQLTGSSIQPQEIVIDAELLEQLDYFHLLDEPIQLQDHFIKARTALRKNYIDVIGWQRKGYEIWYLCKRENTTAGFRTNFNGQYVFNNRYLKLPAQTNSEVMFEEGQKLLSNLQEIIVKRNTPETILSKIEFDLALEERLPFTKSLYDDLQSLLNSVGIEIDEIEHQNYRERYYFKRTFEKVTLDFEYNGDGFFGRVVPIERECNSTTLLNDILSKLQVLKTDHVTTN
jgi:hypothetical protein